MASFECVGFINNIKYLQDSVLVFIDEYHKGYKKSDGSIVDDKYLSFKTIWKSYFKRYINEHFGNGMLVQVKGEMLPYEIQKGTIIDGYTIIGQTINLFSFPRSGVKQEQRMIKESQLHASEIPDLEAHNQPDF